MPAFFAKQEYPVKSEDGFAEQQLTENRRAILVRNRCRFHCSRIRGAFENQRTVPQFSHSSAATTLNMATAKTMPNGRVPVNRVWPQ